MLLKNRHLEFSAITPGRVRKERLPVECGPISLSYSPARVAIDTHVTHVAYSFDAALSTLL